MRWLNTLALGHSGFVQARLETSGFPPLVLAEIQFHAPDYCVYITRHVKGYVDNQRNGPPRFRSIKEAKAWAIAAVRLS